MFPKIWSFITQIIHFNRGFHYFHHPFWDTPIFGNTHISEFLLARFLRSRSFWLGFFGETCFLAHWLIVLNMLLLYFWLSNMKQIQTTYTGAHLRNLHFSWTSSPTLFIPLYFCEKMDCRSHVIPCHSWSNSQHRRRRFKRVWDHKADQSAVLAMASWLQKMCFASLETEEKTRGFVIELLKAYH